MKWHLLGILAAMLLYSNGYAAVVESGTINLEDSGLGNQLTILTASGAGCVGRAGGVDVVGGATCESWSGILGPTNLNQTQTRSFGELGIASPSDLRLVFNPAETGSDPGVTLVDLVAMVFSSTGGSPLFTASLGGALVIPDAGTGTGTSGFLFVLDGDSQQGIAPFLDPSNRLGLAFATVQQDGADETFFFFGPSSADEPTGVPEPAVTYLLVSGLGMMWFLRRWTGVERMHEAIGRSPRAKISGRRGA
ncbi:MAG: PEP-CTERM sorting domain-containing protein [Acidobacteria bacterium]|nr:PEP-CTERM sorting domain-containing protein [Acidobacteriota bacterium]MBI3278504.1 PEP-CTERM sorting domain-containing protein [Acidobacteriota bacterium]